jgi:hypothetical protein
VLSKGTNHFSLPLSKASSVTKAIGWRLGDVILIQELQGFSFLPPRPYQLYSQISDLQLGISV